MSFDTRTNVDYWEGFYKQKGALQVPSQFCVMVATEISSGHCVVELGCGNGRDSIYLASLGYPVCGIDLSHQAVEGCVNSAKELSSVSATFIQGNLSQFDDLKELLSTARKSSKDGTIVCYSRFVMHSLNDRQEAEFFENISRLMRPSEKIYFEFRSKEDEQLDKTFGNHFRRFIDTDLFIDNAVSKYGYRTTYNITGRGMAKYKAEDPMVSRIILEKL